MAPPLPGSTAHAGRRLLLGCPLRPQPRAACRLATLGFTEVYDYVAGKVDWLARNLAVQGTAANAPVADVRARIVGSPHRFALVTTAETTLLGRLRAATLDNSDDALRVSELMEAGPSTLRPHEPAAVIRARLDDKGLTYAIVTDPDGHLVGTVHLTDLP
jgi:CBS-domain-containing membrane protein